jgi:queuine/archaeosine tRNA-ribosyltransferase
LHYIIFCFVLALVLIFITVARILNETYALRKTGRKLIWGSHRPLHGVANVKSLVANDETGFKVLTLKDLLESSKVNRQPTGKREMKFKE